MVDMLAIAAAAAWLLVFGWCSVVTSRPAVRADTGDPGPGLVPAKPAREKGTPNARRAQQEGPPQTRGEASKFVGNKGASSQTVEEATPPDEA